MKRRDFVRSTSLALAAACAGTAGGRLVRAANAATTRRGTDVAIALTARPGKVALLTGPRTDVWSYHARALEGPPSTVTRIPRSYLGPVLRVRQGQRLRVEFRNRLPEATTVHWHGMHVPSDMDGHPKDAVASGGRRTYEFEVLNRAGTYWFHPHPHGRTAEQVYYGLAGVLIVHDDEEEALGLPSGARDLVLVLQDREFDRSNRLVYRGGFGGMAGGAGGMLGSEMLVNGRPNASIDVAAEPYRLRLLNGSNSRIFKVAWSDGTPLDVIGTDGGLLRRPVRRGYVTLAPAERIELFVDFRGWQVGATPQLVSLPFRASTGGPGGALVDQGAAFEVLQFPIVREGPGEETLPKRLSRIPVIAPGSADNAARPRPFEFAGGAFGAGGFWTINGRTFDMSAVAADETVAAGATEIWELRNPGTGGPGGGMMSMRMPHPIHIHGSSFQIIDREVDSGAGFHQDWLTVAEGYVDEGWKDTVLLMPGETVRVIRRFDDFTGLYLIHCHNLEHEDAGMMRNFRIS